MRHHHRHQLSTVDSKTRLVAFAKNMDSVGKNNRRAAGLAPQPGRRARRGAHPGRARTTPARSTKTCAGTSARGTGNWELGPLDIHTGRIARSLLLIKRNQNTKNEVEKRSNAFEEDIKHWSDYDYVIINNNLDVCFKQIEHIILNEKKKLSI